MANDYPFFAFCSSVMNSKTSRKKFLDPKKQAELFDKFGLSRKQKQVSKALDIDGITAEIRKELVAASRSSTEVSRVAIGW